MDQRRASSVAKTAPTTTAKPVSLPERVFSAEESEPPDARGDAPPMSSVKAASERPYTTKTTIRATARTAQTMTITRERSIAAPYTPRLEKCPPPRLGPEGTWTREK